MASYCKHCGDEVPKPRAGATILNYGCVICFRDECTTWGKQFTRTMTILPTGNKGHYGAYSAESALELARCTNKYQH